MLSRENVANEIHAFITVYCSMADPRVLALLSNLVKLSAPNGQTAVCQGPTTVCQGPTTVCQGQGPSDTLEYSLPIKVINYEKKRQSKTFMLRHLNKDKPKNLVSLKEEIVAQLGQEVRNDLKFDVGYLSGSQRISFVSTDNITEELKTMYQKGKTLWCEGRGLKDVIDVDSSDDEEVIPKAPKKQKTTSAAESKAQRIDSIANELKEKHKDKYSKIQYKLWAEALDVKKHTSTDEPPPGPIWNTQKPNKKSSVDTMALAFTSMANSVASAFSPPTKPPVDVSSDSSVVCISPGRRIDFQEKLLKQIDLLHKMCEKGAITSQQFEKRRDSLMIQFDKLSENSE